MGDPSKKQNRAFVDGLRGGGVGSGGGDNCGGFFSVNGGKGVACGSGLSGANGSWKRGKRGEGGPKAFVWIWRTERVPCLFPGLSFVAGKLGKKG